MKAVLPSGKDRGWGDVDDYVEAGVQWSGGPDRTRICDLYRVKVAL
jgi:hypothetical protein